MSTSPAVPELRITRVFPCSLERLWTAWTDWQATVQWWGPVEWPAVAMEADFREGGAWRAELRSASGESLHQSGRFIEIVPHLRIVFSFRWDGDNHEDGPGVDTTVTVAFSESPDGARMEFVQQGLASDESVGGHTHGWNSTFDRLLHRLRERDA